MVTIGVMRSFAAERPVEAQNLIARIGNRYLRGWSVPNLYSLYSNYRPELAARKCMSIMGREVIGDVLHPESRERIEQLP